MSLPEHERHMALIRSHLAEVDAHLDRMNAFLAEIRHDADATREAIRSTRDRVLRRSPPPHPDATGAAPARKQAQTVS